MSIDGWYEVDETGHVPYVAAELPRGHKVYLDASGNIGAILAPDEEPMSVQISAQNDASPALNAITEELTPANAPDNDAAETPAQGG